MNLNFAKTPRIIWAIDAFHDRPKMQLRALAAVQRLYAKSELTVVPVAMLRGGTYDAKSRRFLGTWKELASAAHRNVTLLLKGVRLPGLAPARLLQQKSPSVSDSVHGLIQFAIEENADVIVVSGHARKGAERLVLGSFAESLILRSPIPVLAVNPKSKIGPPVRQILFPSDFSEASHGVFSRVVDLARSQKLRIMILHKLETLYPVAGAPLILPTLLAPNVAEAKSATKKTADKWIREARAKGVKASLHLDAKPGPALDAVVRAAKKLGTTSVIAMASQSGPLATILLGSLTRQVLRQSPCPILVIHPKQKSLVREFVDQVTLIGYAYTASPMIT